jgi:hypothetical protein
VARERGVTLVASLHQVDVALRCFPRVLGLRDGRVLFDLPAAEVDEALLARLYAQHEHERQGVAPMVAPSEVRDLAGRTGRPVMPLSAAAPARRALATRPGAAACSGAARCCCCCGPCCAPPNSSPGCCGSPSAGRQRRFLAGFWPPRMTPFLAMLAREPGAPWPWPPPAWRWPAAGAAADPAVDPGAVDLGPVRAHGAGPFWVRQAVRWLLIVLRSVPELVWALVFVRVVGLGPTAGVLAIALTYAGMLGKVYGEILESGEPMPPSLLRNGAGRLQAFCYGLLPSCAAELGSYTVYRWECAIRSSVVLGFVGAGGLGQQLDSR